VKKSAWLTARQKPLVTHLPFDTDNSSFRRNDHWQRKEEGTGGGLWCCSTVCSHLSLGKERLDEKCWSRTTQWWAHPLQVFYGFLRLFPCLHISLLFLTFLLPHHRFPHQYISSLISDLCLCLGVCVCLCVFVTVYNFMCVSVRVCVCMCVWPRLFAWLRILCVCRSVCLSLCVCVCVRVCMCVTLYDIVQVEKNSPRLGRMKKTALEYEILGSRMMRECVFCIIALLYQLFRNTWSS